MSEHTAEPNGPNGSQRRFCAWLLALVLSAFSPLLCAADEEPAEPQGPETLRVFLECDRGCDFDFLRREIVYVDYVRDPRDAKVHVLVTREDAAAGREFTLKFVGLEEHASEDQTLRYSHSSTDTDDERRRGIARVLQIGLLRYLLDTPILEGLQISYEPPQGKTLRASDPGDDPWNFWVFRTSGRASLSDEDRRSSSSYFGWFSASRTTELWRMGMSVSGSYSETSFEFDDGETFTDVSRGSDIGGRFIRSIGEHWGIGTGATVRRSTFLNLEPSFRLASALEYNVFPYSESSERELTFAYFLGGTQLEYSETTILGENSEVRADHGFFVAFDVEQPWGESSIDFKASHFLDDVDLYRAELSGRLEWRIVRGLSIDLHGSASLVRDQIFLPSRGATEEEILLERRALATGSRLRFGIGLSYTFGSIYNNVVNSRFSNRSGGFHRIF